MSKTVYKYIGQLSKDDIISNDIHKDRRLLVKAGTPITPLVIIKLNQWGIEKVRVVHPDFKNNPNILNEITSDKKNLFLFSKSNLDIKELFYESLQQVVNESRYGFILHQEEQVELVEKLFISALSNSKILSGILTLKKMDPYTYYHSFDVFLLGALLADHIGVSDLEMFSASCLIHDIGKLRVSKEILQKQEKLTKSEFEEIQNHTMYGAEWLKDKNMPEYYHNLVKLHHERLDGSGYPYGLTAKELSSEVRMLGIIDTYSALTLERPYREPFTSTKAIELLMSKPTKYDSFFVIHFIELLNIYPAGCMVMLSNGKKAKIKAVNESQPYRPLLEEVNSSRTFELPTNLSITIPRFLKYDHTLEWNDFSEENDRNISWNKFLTCLITGDKYETIEAFNKLTNGMTTEKIFIDVIVNSIKQIEMKWAQGQLSVGEEHDALLMIKDLFNITLHKMNEQKLGQ